MVFTEAEIRNSFTDPAQVAAGLWSTPAGILYLKFAYEHTSGKPSNLVTCIRHPRRRTPIGVFDGLNVNPQDLIHWLLEDNKGLSYGYTQGSFKTIQEMELFRSHVKGNIGKAERVLLAGCIEEGSLSGLLGKLQIYGFRGEIDVYDLNPNIIKFLSASKEAWKKEYGIKVNLHQGDLTLIQPGWKTERPGKIKALTPDEEVDALSIPYGYYDFIFMDVLGPYIGSTEIQRDLPVIAELLKDDGFLMVSEMETYGRVNVTNVSDAAADEEALIRRDRDICAWMMERYNVGITEEEASFIRRNLFSPDTPARTHALDYMSFFLSRYGLLPIMDTLVTSAGYAGNLPARVFDYMLFARKESARGLR